MKHFTFLTAWILLVSCGSATKREAVATPEGNWELEFLSAPGSDFKTLFPDQKPTLQYVASESRVSGKNGCNSYGGPATFVHGRAHFETDKFIMTRMFCPGNGEKTFMETLGKMSHYSVSPDGKELTLLQGDIAMMRFRKK